MSASREKKQRQDAGPSGKVSHAQAEQAAYRKKVRLYSVIAIVIAVAVAALLVWNSGIFQKNKTAAVIGSEKLTTAELGYYYYGARYMYAMYGLIDTSKSDADQIYNAEENKSYRDYFLENALESAQRTLAVYEKAVAAGYKDADVKDDLDAQVASLKASGANSGYNYKTTLTAMYGRYMTPAVYEKLVTRELVANAYYSDLYNERKDALTEDDLQEYYKENADTVDTFEYSYLYFKADAVTSTNEDGSTRTDEELAELKKAAMDAAKEKADEALAQYEDGITLTALIDTLEPTTSADHTSVVGSSSISSIYQETLLGLDTDEAAVVEYTDTGYYMIVSHGRHLDESATAEIRQIFVSAEIAEDADEPTDEAWTAAEAKANELLDSWKAGEKTAESFGTLATENNMSNGGLVTGFTASSTSSEDMKTWIFADGRAAGDTTVIKYESGSYHGYYVLYYQGEGDPAWKLTAANSLASDAMSAWMDENLTGYSAQLDSGAENLGR